MLDYFKNRKIKKNLINLTASYNTLIKDKKEYIDSNTDDHTLQEAVISKFNLEITKVVAYYEELTHNYPKFYLIESKDDLWKLDKPKEAEGTVFTSTFSTPLVNTESHNAYFLIKAYNTIEAINETNLQPYLSKAIKVKKEKELKQEAQDFLDSFYGPITLLDSSKLLSIADYLKPYLEEKQTTIHALSELSTEELNQIVKHYKLNIIRN